jgi:hypothetical protein
MYVSKYDKNKVAVLQGREIPSCSGGEVTEMWRLKTQSRRLRLVKGVKYMRLDSELGGKRECCERE